MIELPDSITMLIFLSHIFQADYAKIMYILTAHRTRFSINRWRNKKSDAVCENRTKRYHTRSDFWEVEQLDLRFVSHRLPTNFCKIMKSKKIGNDLIEIPTKSAPISHSEFLHFCWGWLASHLFGKVFVISRRTQV